MFSPKSRDKRVSVFNITKGRPSVEFSSYSHLAEYLPIDKRAEPETWANMVEHVLGGDIRSIGGTQRCPFPLSVVEANVGKVVQALMLLAQR